MRNAAAVTHLPPWGQGSRRPWLRQAAGSSQLLMTDTHPTARLQPSSSADRACKMFKPISPLGFANVLSSNLTARPWEYLFPVEPSCYGDLSPMQVSLPGREQCTRLWICPNYLAEAVLLQESYISSLQRGAADVLHWPH